jgi:hypothetical protein
MNAAVDLEHRDVAATGRDFLSRIDTAAQPKP